MRLVINLNYLTFKFRIQPEKEWCKVDTELIQAENYPVAECKLPFPCKADCHIMGDESISVEELSNLETGFTELYAGVENFERPYFVEPVIDIEFIAPYISKSTFLKNSERVTEYFYYEPEMVLKINLTAPYTGCTMENFISLRFNSEQTLYFYTYIRFVCGMVSKNDKTLLKMLEEGVLIDD